MLGMQRKTDQWLS